MRLGQYHVSDVVGNRPASANDPTHFCCERAGGYDPVVACLQTSARNSTEPRWGDERRSARLERIGETLARDPSRSFPEAMASEGQLEALYRFLNNDGAKTKSASPRVNPQARSPKHDAP
jgi:hypothetical protein